MDYKLGNLAHIELAGGDMAKTKDFYTKCFAWKFMPMNDTYEFFDAGNATGAIDKDMKPGAGALLYLACDDVAAKLKEIERAGAKIIKPRTEIGGGHGFFAHFQDPAGNRMGVWQPARKA